MEMLPAVGAERYGPQPYGQGAELDPYLYGAVHRSKCAAFCVKKYFRGYCKRFDTYLDVFDDDVEEGGDG